MSPSEVAKGVYEMLQCCFCYLLWNGASFGRSCQNSCCLSHVTPSQGLEPGSGKRYTIDTICELASVMKIGVVVTTSYNGKC
jgi:hypothetical protein